MKFTKEEQKEIEASLKNVLADAKVLFDLIETDLYRFDFEDEFLAIGGEEFFDNGICLIEWGEKIQSYLPKEYIKISITKDNEDINKRIIKLTPVGNKYNTLLSEVYDK